MERSVDMTENARKSAEMLAAQAFSWVTEDEARLNDFMGMTGASPADLVRNITSAAFLGTVLDFILTEDRLVKDFCDARGISYTAPMQARAALPGGASWHWT